MSWKKHASFLEAVREPQIAPRALVPPKRWSDHFRDAPNNRTVKRKAVDILKEALALPSEERAALAASLLESLDTDVEEDAEAAWLTEVHRRLAELDCCAVNTVPWAEVRR
jgi:putative addiction module component (TIGR02574 family)